MTSMSECACAQIIAPNERPNAALLPWEDEAEWRDLREEFHADLQPAPGAEAALVDQLAAITWRRRRLAQAERAAHMAQLHRRIDDFRERDLIACRARGFDRRASRAGRGDDRWMAGREGDAAELRELEVAAALAASARREALSGANDAYDRAVALLHADTREWWLECVKDAEADELGEGAAERTAKSLVAFIDHDVAEHVESERAAIAAFPAVRQQAYGESFDPEHIERLLAISERLDRQFERALTNLTKLQQRRAARK